MSLLYSVSTLSLAVRLARADDLVLTEPRNPATGRELNVENALFGEKPGDAIKFQSPHVVDHGAENVLLESAAFFSLCGLLVLTFLSLPAGSLS